jgi:hypothetical protein
MPTPALFKDQIAEIEQKGKDDHCQKSLTLPGPYIYTIRDGIDGKSAKKSSQN